MQSFQRELNDRMHAAIEIAFPDADLLTAQVRSAGRDGSGQFQTGIAMKLAKAVGETSVEIARRISAVFDSSDLCEPPTVTGKGFINFTIRNDVLADRVSRIGRDSRQGVPTTHQRLRVVVDYSSPNIAKEMHVGHLRSTVIGDAIARILEFRGYEVTRQNHVGDWGTQFGMLIEAALSEEDGPLPQRLSELDDLYRRARAKFDSDAGFADRSRLRVVALQGGDPTTLAMWKHIVDVSLDGFAAIYKQLASDLTNDDVAGESGYNNELGDVVRELSAAGLLTESDGALCAFLPGFEGRDGAPLPVIVRKADGGFGYVATDLAALRYRVRELHADRLIYVVDNRQTLHFQQVFALAKAAGWLTDGIAVEHVAFGTVLGEDGRPFKTRAGEAVPLSSLLLEATQRAARIAEFDPDAMSDEERITAEAIGIGAIKFADLANDRNRDYVFSMDRMVALDGNTGPYLQYAHARISKILARAHSTESVGSSEMGSLRGPVEVRLALLICDFPSVVEATSSDLLPHRLCAYLSEVAVAFSSFYESCPVLSAESAVRRDRLALCRVTQSVLASGLHMLGITPLTEMP